MSGERRKLWSHHTLSSFSCTIDVPMLVIGRTQPGFDWRPQTGRIKCRAHHGGDGDLGRAQKGQPDYWWWRRYESFTSTSSMLLRINIIIETIHALLPTATSLTTGMGSSCHTSSPPRPEISFHHSQPKHSMVHRVGRRT